MPSATNLPTTPPSPWAALSLALLPPLELSLASAPLKVVMERAARASQATIRPPCWQPAIDKPAEWVRSRDGATTRGSIKAAVAAIRAANTTRCGAVQS